MTPLRQALKRAVVMAFLVVALTANVAAADDGGPSLDSVPYDPGLPSESVPYDPGLPSESAASPSASSPVTE